MSRRLPKKAGWFGAVTVTLVAVSVVSSGAPEAVSEHPFDPYPGLGRSPAARERDRAIATWEAYRHQESIQQCLASHGFAYELDLPLPGDWLVSVGATLDVRPHQSPGKPASRQNESYVSNLTSSERDRYFRAFVGESAADMDSAASTGAPPPGKGASFATGGCYGQAAAAVGSIWDLKRDLTPERVRLSQAASTDPELTAEYQNCTAENGGPVSSTPGALEAMRPLPDTDPAQIDHLLQACESAWGAAYRKAEFAVAKVFVEHHAEELEAARLRYEGVPEALRQDDSFRRHLALEQAWFLADLPEDGRVGSGAEFEPSTTGAELAPTTVASAQARSQGGGGGSRSLGGSAVSVGRSSPGAVGQSAEDFDLEELKAAILRALEQLGLTPTHDEADPFMAHYLVEFDGKVLTVLAGEDARHAHDYIVVQVDELAGIDVETIDYGTIVRRSFLCNGIRYETDGPVPPRFDNQDDFVAAFIANLGCSLPPTR